MYYSRLPLMYYSRLRLMYHSRLLLRHAHRAVIRRSIRQSADRCRGYRGTYTRAHFEAVVMYVRLSTITIAHI